MNLVELYSLASQLEVSLRVDDVKEKIIATPTQNVTDDLRDGVKENRDTLMRDLLVQRAISWVWENRRGSGSLGEVNESIPRADVEGVSFQEFRAALGRWAKGMVDGMKGETTLHTTKEVVEAFKEEREARGGEAA